MPSWRPWHGCRRCSPGCLNCYVYRGDARFERDGRVYPIPRAQQLEQASRSGISTDYQIGFEEENG